MTVVCLTGAPGSGKTTVGQAIAARAVAGVHIQVDFFRKMVRAGYTRSVCMSHDATCGAWLGRPSFDGKRVIPPELIAQFMPNWEPTHLFKRILPKMREMGLTQADIDTIFVSNPARYFGGVEAPR